MNVVTLLDTGEHFVTCFRDASMVHTAKCLYKEMDITAVEHTTAMVVDDTTAGFVESVTGRIFAYPADAFDIARDMAGVIEFCKINSKYKGPPAPAEPETVPSKPALAEHLDATVSWNVGTRQIPTHQLRDFTGQLACDQDGPSEADSPPLCVEDGGSGCPLEEAYMESLDAAATPCPPGNETPSLTLKAYCPVAGDAPERIPEPRGERKTLLFNTLYNVSILVQASKLSVVDQSDARIDGLCRAFPEFVRVAALHVEECLLPAFAKLFHKTSFDDVGVMRAKIGAFKELYGTCVEADTAPLERGRTERENVLDVLKEWFQIDDDPTKRKKASALYLQVASLIGKTDQLPQLSRRLPGYFLEAGLRKKRMSDGYFYYGIEQRSGAPTTMPASFEFMSSDQLGALSPDDVSVMRRNDLEGFRKARKA